MNEAATPEAYPNHGLAQASATERRWTLPLVCLGVLVAASGAYLLLLESRLTFRIDDWEFLLHRRGTSASVFLDPHNDHIAIIPVAIYKSLLGIFGMDSALPFQVVSTFVFLLSAVLLFVYLRRRVGDWAAVLGSALILFLGASWVDLLWSFQVGFSGSIGAGLGALLALDREDRVGDLLACLLLAVSVAFSELGIAFTAGALVTIAISRRQRLDRLYVPFVPILAYVAWWLGWGHTAESAFSLHNVLASPKYVFDAMSQALASLLGLATPLEGGHPEPTGLLWGRILLVVALVATAWRLWRLGRVPRPLFVAFAIGGTFWFLAAFNALPVLREPTSGRYQYPGAVFILLIAAEILRGVRLGRRVLSVATVVTAAAVTSGILFLHNGYRLVKAQGEVERAKLAGLEMARRTVDPRFKLSLDLFTTFTAGTYFSAVDAFGSPAYTQSQLVKSPDGARVAADATLAQALGLRLAKVSPAVGGAASEDSAPARCDRIEASGSGRRGALLRPGDFILRDPSAPGPDIRIARFADVASVDLGHLAVGEPMALKIPADRSDRPWRLMPIGQGTVTICVSRPA